MSATATISQALPQSLPTRRLVAFFFMVFGMFMAILDIQIVSSSLAEIQAGISASADEIPWVQTSYLIAEVVMIPLSGTLTRIFSTRWLFVAASASFTLMSLMCALSSSIGEMMVWRALQGFLGGAMIPTVFSTLFTIFPAKQRAIFSPVIGLIATLAPTIGPTVGGYLTDIFSWHWLFLVNIIPGICVTIGTWLTIDFDEPNFKLIKTFDWLGMFMLAIFLGSLEYILEEGAADDWLNSDVIRNLIIACILSGSLFFWRMFAKPNPLVDFSAFKNRNFTAGCIFSFTMGIGLYGLTYLYPVYLARIQNYSSMMIGETMFVTGIAMFLTAPIAGRLSLKVDPRIMIGGGFIGFAIGTWQAHYITSDWAFWELLIPQILRGVSLMMCMVTVTNIALGDLSPMMLRGGSGLFNLTRNLGGAVGLALINTTMNLRFDLHLQRLHESVGWSNDVAVHTLNNMTHAFSKLGSNADLVALRQLSLLVRKQSFTLAIADIFFVLTILFLSIVLMLPLLKKAKPVGSSSAH